MATVKQGQSFLDLVIQETGNIANSFEMTVLNGVSITDFLPVGAEVKAAGKLNRTVMDVFNDNNKPATYTNQKFGGFSSGFSLGFNVE